MVIERPEPLKKVELKLVLTTSVTVDVWAATCNAPSQSTKKEKHPARPSGFFRRDLTCLQLIFKFVAKALKKLTSDSS